jgi:hypothetical protein
MTLSTASRVLLAVIVVCAAGPAETRADDFDRNAPHIRMEAGLESILIDAMQSSTFQALVTRLDHSNLVVYVRCRTFEDRRLDGRLSLMGATPDSRFTVVELACPRARLSLGATLGHEIRHAVEIAAAPSVVDPASFQKLYERIGFRLWGDTGAVRFDTNAAIDTGGRIRRELQRALVDLKRAPNTTEEAK